MARNGDVNQVYPGTSAGASQVTFAIKTQAKLAGWTVPRSSDGTTYNAAGDQCTVSGSGAGGFLNTGAWWIIRDPGGRRELCFQSNTSGQLRIKYSASAKFTGGSPGATQTPSATDEQVLLGAGTNASPTYAGLWVSGPQRFHVVADPTPVGGAYYLGVFITQVAAATHLNGMFVMEPLAPGSYDASDGDPVVLYCAASTAYGSSMACWFAYGTGSATWQTVISTSNGPFTAALGVDIGSNKDVNGRPWYVCTITGSVRIKGVGAFIAAKGPPRVYPATMNTATDAYAYLGSYVWPYINNTVPSVS